MNSGETSARLQLRAREALSNLQLSHPVHYKESQQGAFLQVLIFEATDTFPSSSLLSYQ